ncbi:RNB domain-containing ribonuclease [Ilumatobacter coccineus]|jgi:exoribonuclease R|uniref:Putative ribonuclease n=1 Tax=Ilumatobacter coccineus (strain NBRC 103263 / KCTC 29153 / YM16-304) TaxID=1313172 RepID=A0A6C7E7N3_ILUCY|nr:RNB domain-containing ribonuclease [Ilumatobacter coccineus]BAN01219.1 putative ribonuclease [Ilumatobacter coccineus YM16-304]
MARTGQTFIPDDDVEDFREGFARLRDDFDVPGEHPDEVKAAAEVAAARPFDVVQPGEPAGQWQHVDRTDVEFLTLDPATSTDLDQAFAIEMAGDDVVLHYAIADVGWFVRHGDPIDREAWRRGVTVYLPDGRAGLHPERIAEDAGSLLPGGPKPAVVFTVRVAGDGSVRLDGVERAMVRNRAKLAYSTVTPADLPDAFPELSRRIEENERRRGSDRIQWPEQEVVRRPGGGFELRFRPRNDAENQNAAMSLATNMAVADALLEAETGLFRTMPGVDERRLGRLRHTARAFGLDWPKAMSLGEFERSLPRGEPRTSAFLLAVRRAGGGASYTPYAEIEGDKPWHAAVAATYVHATAPLRRLADRYVIEATLAIANGRAVPDEVEQAFSELPEAMRRGDSRANRVDRAAIDLAEAIVLQDQVGEVFEAVITDEDDRGVRIQIREPAVVARTTARRVDPGDEIQVKLVAADPVSRSIDFERVG